MPPVAIVYRREKCRLKKLKPNERPPIEIDPNKPTRYNCNDTYYIFGTRIADGVNDLYIITGRQYYNTYIAPEYRYTSIDYMHEFAQNEIRNRQEIWNNYQGDYRDNLYLISDYTIERATKFDYLEHPLGGLNNPKLRPGIVYGEALHEFDVATDRFIQTLGKPFKFYQYQISWYQNWYEITYYTYNPNKGTPLQFWRLPLYYDVRHELVDSSNLLPDCVPTFFSPPPPPPKRQCCMSCCPNRSNDDTLLRLLIQKVDKLSKIVGVDEYPASLPASLISRDEGFLGNLIPNFNTEIPNLTRLISWYVERFDEIMGQWEIPVEVKDSDPTKPGDQPLGVKLPNMAEAIAEIFTLAFQANLNSEVLLNFAVRSAAEISADKQQNFISYKLLQSLTDWAGFKQKDIKLKMPLLFTLGKTRYDEILKESEVDVGVVDFDEKFGLEADLMRFREAAAMLQANYKQKIDPNGDIKAQILKYLLDTFKSANNINGSGDDFDQFLKDVEVGFTNVSGVSDSTHPYGRDFSARPKIKDLTKNDPPASE